MYLIRTTFFRTHLFNVIFEFLVWSIAHLLTGHNWRLPTPLSPSLVSFSQQWWRSKPRPYRRTTQLPWAALFARAARCRPTEKQSWSSRLAGVVNTVKGSGICQSHTSGDRTWPTGTKTNTLKMWSCRKTGTCGNDQKYQTGTKKKNKWKQLKKQELQKQAGSKPRDTLKLRGGSHS